MTKLDETYGFVISSMAKQFRQASIVGTDMGFRTGLEFRTGMGLGQVWDLEQVWDFGIWDLK